LYVPEVVDHEQYARLFGALADPVRLRFVRELMNGKEKSGSAIAEALGISLALLCHHSRVLVESGLVLKRKEAQTAYFKANTRLLKQTMRELLG
jgi:DNA-binding transcriptional ArsR family regulator